MRTSAGGTVYDVRCDRCGEYLGTVEHRGPREVAEMSIDYCPALEDCVSHLGDRVKALESKSADGRGRDD